ncbi:MAG: glycerol-3-phosphate 1-O-acyltransferase PlsY [Alphaproteobacteria bacterium]|nr:glycerol-3-phosphate 1-O-acyltransferase PlsY [Alphaproteobacteria bacterium]
MPIPAAALLALTVGYLLGSIPFGLILTRLAGAGDIRTVGSGNIGATNVLRTGRKGLAAATLLLDALKGAAAVLIMRRANGGDAALAAALGAVAGHMFPVWLRFQGGKGVATFIGALIAVSLPVAAAFGVIWGAVAALTRYSSLSALIACACVPPLLWHWTGQRAALVFLALAVLVFVRHRGNIARLMRGSEPKIGARTPDAPKP